MKVYVVVSYEYDDVHMSWAEAEACFTTLEKAIKGAKRLNEYASCEDHAWMKEVYGHDDNICLDYEKRNTFMKNYQTVLYIKEIELED